MGILETMNGKGDKPRPGNLKRYQENFDAIRWSDRKLPVKYYDGVPGEYMCQCATCRGTFLGDKRDLFCPACTDHACRMEDD